MSSSTTRPDATEREKMLRGDLYRAFSTELIAERSRCALARHEFNERAVHVERIERINLWNKYTPFASRIFAGTYGYIELQAQLPSPTTPPRIR